MKATNIDHFYFQEYCKNFLTTSAGEEFLFKDSKLTYKEFIEKVFVRAEEIKRLYLKDDPLFLQEASPENLFYQLMAGIIASKKMVILSSKLTTFATQKIKDEANALFSLNTNSALFYLLSSGTTGKSKLISLSLQNIYSSATGVIDTFQMQKNDTSFLNLPTHHIGGLMVLWRAFFSCSAITLNENENYQFVSLVPLQLKRLLDHPEKIASLQKCRAILIGGALLSAELKDIAISHHKLKIYETYGMTETCSLVLLNGRPMGEVQVKLSSDSLFLIKGPVLSPDVTVDSEGFYHTQDQGKINPDGGLQFVSRADLLFKSAGELIDPQEIERVVKELPGITEALVIPIAHPEWSNATTLLYQSNDLQSSKADILQMLKEHLQKSLHPFHLPKYYFLANDNIIGDGEIKPSRFMMAHHIHRFFFHHHYIPSKTSVNTSVKLIVFFHGFMEDHTDMLALADIDPDAAYLFFDFPGHGQTPLALFSSREFFFMRLAQFIKSFPHQELIFYGYSMGGRMALELAIDHLKPDRLILESASFGHTTDQERRERLASDKKLFLKIKNLKSFFASWYQNPIFSHYQLSPNYEQDIEKKLSHDYLQWQKSLDELFSPGLSPYLLNETLEKSKNYAIRVIGGEKDCKYIEHYLGLANQLSNFKLLIIKDSGHNPHKTHLSLLLEMLTKNCRDF